MRAADRIGSTEEMASVADVGVELGDLRAALDTRRGRPRDISLQLVGALGWYAYTAAASVRALRRSMRPSRRPTARPTPCPTPRWSER